MGKMLPRAMNMSRLLIIGFMICCCVSNKIVAAADLKCYQCVGEACEDPEVKTCSATATNEQCYVRIDNNNDIVAMGCASALGDGTVLTNLIQNKQLYVCSSSLCNGFENLPTSNECTKCDSATHENCATQPQQAFVTSRCGVLPFTQCYERINVLGGGTTERGCLFDLPSAEFYGCMSGEDKNCNVCVGKGCNKAIIPADRHQCQRCDSATDSNCIGEPTALSYCPRYVANDACVSHYDTDKEVTYRRCASELSCNQTERNCQICTANGCNIADMQRRSKELYGAFQDLPLNCNTCTGEKNCAETGQHLRKCEGNIHQDCLTVFGTQGSVLARGCEDNIDAAYLIHCAKNPELCFNCKSNGCNNVKELPSPTFDCLYCDTATDPDCLLNIVTAQKTRTCLEGCVTALYENKTRPDTYELARTCFEDLEYDDRETCTEANNNCTKCDDTVGCNTALLPAEGRLSCLHCDGGDCDAPISQLCSTYWTSDQCYMYFDAVTHSVVRMGCKSSLDTDAMLNDVVNYFVCDGDDCNTYENLPEAHFCYVCNSADDLNCAADVSLVKDVVSCEINPHTDCFSRVTEDGHTERGCISSLNNTNFLNCHQGTPGQYCAICTENYCNGDEYPSARARCYRCNSADDPDCQTAPKNRSICPLYNEHDYCVSKWVDGITYRGCSSDQLLCEEGTTAKNCRMCQQYFCNSAVLEGEYPIGYPGLFQDLPLNCYECDNADSCSSANLGNVQKCDDNIYQTCATVFDKRNGSLIGRGCSDKFTEACDDANNNCYHCKSSGCNVVKVQSDYVDCIFCDGETDEKCIDQLTEVRSTRKCYQNCVTTLYNRTYDDSSASSSSSSSSPPIRELIRTCLDDMEYDERDACLAGQDENCKVCSTSKCNTAELGSHISCYQCEGDECEDPVMKTCHAISETDQCYQLYDEQHSIIALGCKSNLEPAAVKALVMAQRLWLCDGDNCNTFEAVPAAQMCTICSSTTDEDCAVAPNAVRAATSCGKLPYTQCYSRILETGHTERGCLSSIEGEDFYDCLQGSNTTKCLACVGDSCNKEIFPANRRSCHQCNSLENPFCESTPDAGAVCLLYNADENCTVKYDDGITYRGCSSALECDAADRQNCRHCADKDNCNTIDLSSISIGEPGRWQDLPLNCYDCEGSECANSNGLLRKCELNNLQTCQTVFGSNDLVVRRGCSDNVTATHETYCEENPNKCLGCKSSACNNATRLNQYIDCYVCDSVGSPQCTLNFEGAGVGVKKRKCQGYCAVALYPRSSATNPAYELERTCLDDMDLDEREACLAGENELCKACNEPLCNMDAIPENRHKCYHCVDEDCADYEVAECKAYKANDQCYMQFDVDYSIVGMGCGSEFEDDSIVALVKSKRFIFCEDAACNAPENIPMAKLCTVCDSRTDPLCATNPNLLTNAEKCTTLPYTDCYTRVDEDNRTTRGCLSTLDAESFYNCFSGNDTLCETCSNDKCNGLDIFPAGRWTCQQCNSETDPQCASAPNNNKVCPIYSEPDSCVTSYKHGVTIRGCASDTVCDNPDDSTACRTCDTAGCNVINLERIQGQGKPGRWQDVPLTCITCEGEQNCASVAGGIHRVCDGAKYQNCMTVFNTDGKVIQRGCNEALDETHYELCEAKPDNCLRCNSNGCNNATKLSDYIECFSCDTDTNGNCVDRVELLKNTRKCNKYCMTALYPKYDESNPSYGLSRSCFDDMDYDEREACAAGKNEFCHVCDTAKCNTQKIPAQRLSCMACKNGDCVDPQPTTCGAYRPDDQCYIQFDEQRNVYGMGCRSEFSHADAHHLLSQQRLFFCGGDDCNTLDAIPESQYCMICSSRTDPNCAVSPGVLEANTLCAKSPYTQCYTRVLPSGDTERGCLSSLYDYEFVGCLNGTSKSCVSCAGSNCNQDLFPENRLSCHICDSANDPKCAYKPNNLSLCPLYAENDKCVTAYINEVTYRGCSSSLKCDDTASKSCAPCEGEGCNTVNLERKQDDNYGKWQDLPLTCLSCSGNDCASQSAQSLRCENNNDQDCMTVFQDGKVVRRGCSDLIEDDYYEYCTQDWKNCPSCKSNNCNGATALSQYTECIYCDTHKNESCLWSAESATHKTRQCQGSCMTVLYPSDGSRTPVYELMRTCLNDKEAADQLQCSAGSDANCQSCSSAKCNTAPLPANRLSCYQCVGDECEEPTLKTCPLYKSDEQCFTTFDDNNTVIQMGCISSFRNQMLEVIIGTKRIQVCDGAGCNSLDNQPTAQKCAVCNSNEDYACATNAAEVGTFSMCTQYPYTNCYTKLDKSDGSTIRGCLSDLPTTDFTNCVLGKDKNCSMCIGEGCNREIFPADRQQCYTCSSADDPDCESTPSRLLPCPFVAETEKCRTAYGGNVTVRGCSSEVFCDAKDRSTCRSCIGTACNSIDLSNREVDDGYHGMWQQLPLRCHTCEAEDCAHSLGPAYNCSGTLAQDCATVFNASGAVKRRGCAEDVEDYEQRYCRQNPHLCFACKSNECNDAWNITDYVECNYCTSETDAACAIDPEYGRFAKRACKQECMVAMKNAHIIRSCLDDKEENVRYVCRDDVGGAECASCDTNNCNDFGYPKDRLKCHVCNDAACRTTTTRYCAPYSKNDFCFAKYENDKVDLLGCASSQNGSDLVAWEEQKKLYKCRGKDCNDLSLLPTAGGKCISCNSANTPACAQNPFGYNVTETCPPLQHECVTYLDEVGHTQRGCLSKLSASELSSCQATGKCSICTSDNCNNEIFPYDRLSCHICNSNSEPSCAKSPNHLQFCTIYAPNDRCVTKRLEQQQVERGCQSELSCDGIDENNCQICESNGCNNAEVTNVTDAAVIATAVSLLTTLVLAILTVVGHRFN